MSCFRRCARDVLECRAPSSSHAWINFLRCVEAHAILTGESFQAVLQRVGQPHGIRPGGKPTTAVLQAAVRTLLEEHDQLLAERQAHIAARRLAKRSGRRTEVPPELAALEGRHHRTSATRPRVGVFGWSELRTRGLGAPVSVDLPGPCPPVFQNRSRRLAVDLRRWPSVELSADLRPAILDAAGQGSELVVVTTRKKACQWTPSLVTHLITRLQGLGWTTHTVWVECEPKAPDIGLPHDTRALLLDRRWTVGRLGHGVLR